MELYESGNNSNAFLVHVGALNGITQQNAGQRGPGMSIKGRVAEGIMRSVASKTG